MRLQTVIFTILLLPAAAWPAGDDLLPFEPGDTLEEIRYKIDYNGYSFTVSDNWISRLSPEEKGRFLSRRRPQFPRTASASDDIGPLARHLGRKVLPSRFDWRDYNGRSYIGPIRDQGYCGSCYAFGAAAAAEGTYNFANGLYGNNCVDFSEAFIAFCLYSHYPDPVWGYHFQGCDGADYDYYELQALVDYGICQENFFPYTDYDQPCGWPQPYQYLKKFQSWHRIPCGDIEAIKTAIMTYGVVDAAVYAESAFITYDGGIYQDTNTSCSSSPCYYTPTNHAIALVGWDDNPPEGGSGVWILRNSYGTSWGEDGYMRIRYTAARVSCEVSYLVYGAAPAPTPVPVEPDTLPIARSGDYDGDGTAEIAVFRPSTGLWAARGVTRAYWGRNGDIPVPADYDGDGTADIAAYRPTTGYWFIKNVTKAYWGRAGDIPVPGNYNGYGPEEIAVFRPSTGLWAIRNLTRAYWGRSGDIPVPGDYNVTGLTYIGAYRPSTGSWFIRNLTKVYWGKPGDIPIPGNYNGLNPEEIAVFRPSSGLWAVRGVTRAYWGRSGDTPVPGRYQGGWMDFIGAYRPSTGYWFIKDLTRVYWGKPGDIPVAR